MTSRNFRFIVTANAMCLLSPWVMPLGSTWPTAAPHLTFGETDPGETCVKEKLRSEGFLVAIKVKVASHTTCLNSLVFSYEIKKRFPTHTHGTGRCSQSILPGAHDLTSCTWNSVFITVHRSSPNQSHALNIPFYYC